jgi:phosphate starvation-inducible PhoH-like protein
VVTGDVSQIDLPRTQLSGLIDAERILKRVPGIAMCRLTSADVVRHPLVARIVDAYDARGGHHGLHGEVAEVPPPGTPGATPRRKRAVQVD